MIRAPVRAMFSRNSPSDSRSQRSCARYWRNPLSRMARAVSSRKEAARRQLSRRQTGSPRLVEIGAKVEAMSGSSRFDVQLRHVALEEELHGPIERHAHARGERGEL